MMSKAVEGVAGIVVESNDDVKIVKKKLVLERKVIGGLKASTALGGNLHPEFCEFK